MIQESDIQSAFDACCRELRYVNRYDWRNGTRHVAALLYRWAYAGQGELSLTIPEWFPPFMPIGADSRVAVDRAEGRVVVYPADGAAVRFIRLV